MWLNITKSYYRYTLISFIIGLVCGRSSLPLLLILVFYLIDCKSICSFINFHLYNYNFISTQVKHYKSDMIIAKPYSVTLYVGKNSWTPMALCQLMLYDYLCFIHLHLFHVNSSDISNAWPVHLYVDRYLFTLSQKGKGCKWKLDTNQCKGTTLVLLFCIS